MEHNDQVQVVYTTNNVNSTKLVVIFIFTIILSLGIGVIGAFTFFHYYPSYFQDSITNVTKTEKEVTINENGIADAVEKIYDSVVVVKTYRKDQVYTTGTGFVYKKIDNTYYMLTNYHVIKDGDRVKVLFTNGKEVAVTIEGGDKYSDIALLSFESVEDLKVSDIGSSVKMRVGDTVFAIGAPLDSTIYSWSVTRGILSGKDREVEVSIEKGNNTDWIMQVLQTDAAINNGNSGGPLCNSNGEVIGITNMKLITSGVEGMGFAIPIEEAVNYADSLIAGEDVRRPYIGVGMQDITNTQTLPNGTKISEGVLLNQIEANSSAARAGLRVGDIVVAVNNVEVKNMAAFRYELYKYSTGDNINIKFIRNGVTGTVKLTLSTK